MSTVAALSLTMLLVHSLGNPQPPTWRLFDWPPAVYSDTAACNLRAAALNKILKPAGFEFACHTTEILR